MIISVFCLDDLQDMLFDATSAQDAMEKALYTLNLSRKDASAVIIETKLCLTFDHSGKTYTTMKNGLYQGQPKQA